MLQVCARLYPLGYERGNMRQGTQGIGGTANTLLDMIYEICRGASHGIGGAANTLPGVKGAISERPPRVLVVPPIPSRV